MTDLPATSRDWLHWHARLDDSIGRSGSVEQTLAGVARSAIETVRGARWASITRSVGGGWVTVVANGEPAAAADRLQYVLDEGPCLSAASGHTSFVSADLLVDPRWPSFGARATTETPVRGVVSVRVVADVAETDASINIYTDHAHVFTAESALVATVLATHAGQLVTAAERAENTRNLQAALASNREIGVAMGVLMALHRVTRDDAFAMLRTASQNSNRRLHDIAVEVADTGILPVVGQRPGHRRRPGTAGAGADS